MIILGINSYHPDSSAAIIVDGKLVAACEEERFKRIKHFAGFPMETVSYCLKEAGVKLSDVDYITIPRKPTARFFKKAIYGIKMPTLASQRLSVWGKAFDIKEKLSRGLDADQETIKAKIIRVEHHRAHLASCFFVSDFNKAFLLSMDALGDFASTMWGVGEGNKIKVLGEITFPHSLGFYYTALTQYLGFLDFGDEYKVMGLAAFGNAGYEGRVKEILKTTKKGFKLNLKYFLHHKKHIDMNLKNGYPKIDQIFSAYLEKRLGKRRFPDEPVEKRHKDIAFSLQKRLEEAVVDFLNRLDNDYSNLCLAGGVAFNCVLNRKILKDTQFRNIYVPPAAGDAGLAIGAAYYLWHQLLNKPRDFVMSHAYWGPVYGDDEIKPHIETRGNEFSQAGYRIKEIEKEDELCRVIAKYISEGKIVGWFQGRMEFGPRALGNRSILADPRREEMRDILNNRIKYREVFRPFAPSVLKEYTEEYFENSNPSPFMSFAYKTKEDKRHIIPAVVHVDGTARLQTVNKDTNPLYWKLITEFMNITGVPVLLNTSFNENEPIVCSPQEALDCFLRTKMNVLAIGNFIINKG